MWQYLFFNFDGALGSSDNPGLYPMSLGIQT
jgi:hypothetical protein